MKTNPYVLITEMIFFFIIIFNMPVPILAACSFCSVLSRVAHYLILFTRCSHNIYIYIYLNPRANIRPFYITRAVSGSWGFTIYAYNAFGYVYIYILLYIKDKALTILTMIWLGISILFSFRIY